MWDCTGCGCRSIAASLETCPMCGRERDMPTCTTGGASNANAVEGETGYVPPEAPDATPVADEVPEVASHAAVADAAEPTAPAADAKVPEQPEAVQAVSEPKPAAAKVAPKLASAG